MMKTRRLGLRKYKKLLRNVDGKMPQQNPNKIVLLSFDATKRTISQTFLT